MPSGSEVLDFLTQSILENEKRKKKNLYGDRLLTSPTKLPVAGEEKPKASDYLALLLSGILDPVGAGVNVAEARGADNSLTKIVKFLNDPLSTGVEKLDKSLKPPDTRYNFPPGKEGDKLYETAVLVGKDSPQTAFLPYLAKNNPVIKQLYRRIFGFSPATDPVVMRRSQKESPNELVTRYEKSKPHLDRGAVFAEGQPRQSPRAPQYDQWDSNYYDPNNEGSLGGANIAVNPEHTFENPMITFGDDSPGKPGGKALLGKDFINKVHKKMLENTADSEHPYRVREKLAAKTAKRAGFDSVISIDPHIIEKDWQPYDSPAAMKDFLFGRHQPYAPIKEIMIIPKGHRTLKAAAVGKKTPEIVHEYRTGISGREPEESVKTTNPQDYINVEKLKIPPSRSIVPRNTLEDAKNIFWKDYDYYDHKKSMKLLTAAQNATNNLYKDYDSKSLVEKKEISKKYERYQDLLNKWIKLYENKLAADPRGFKLHQQREELALLPKPTLKTEIEKALKAAGIPLTSAKKLPIPE